MKVPNADLAEVSILKLRDYCLNPGHDEGKHKARVFAAALGMTSADADVLRELLREAVRTHDAHVGYHDEYGQRYVVDFPVEWAGRRATIRSAWILEHGSEIPRFTSCYVV